MPDVRSGVARQVYQADKHAAANSTAIGASSTVASRVPIPPETLIRKTRRHPSGIHTARYAPRYDRRVKSGCMVALSS
jgi:hypothetical protein